MISNRNTSLLLILVLFLQPINQNLNVSSSSKSNFDFSEIFYLTDYNSRELEDNYNTEDKMIEWVGFFDSVENMNSFLKQSSSSMIKIYGNLKAIRGHISIDDLQLLQSLSVNMLPYSLFEIELESSIINSKSNNQILLNQENPWRNVIASENLFNMGYNGSGVSIAIIDNGVFNHSDFSDSIKGSFDISTESTVPCGNHGTLVAGTISSEPSGGTAIGADLYDVSFGCSGVNVEGDLLAGFDWILVNNDTIDIVNTSFGGFAPAWDFIVKQLESEGIILVGSAGNSGPSFHSTASGGPGNSLHGISIGSVDENLELSFFSSRGPAHNMIYKPDLLAPGEDISTTDNENDYSTTFGTSFSSPIVAGGIATLISALNNNSIGWNPGVIKAALHRSATVIEGTELQIGSGIANIQNAFDLLNSLSKDGEDVPYIVDLHPSINPIDYLRQVPQGVEIKVPITYISSHPQDVVFSLTDDLTGISSISPTSDTYSQTVEITIDTSSFSEGDTISGNLTGNLNGDISSVLIELSVGPSVRGTVGVDTRHTYWDQSGSNQIGGSNIGSMITLAMENGFHVIEIDSEINSTILSQIDLLWMPDSVNILTGTPEQELGFTEEELLMSEINAIHDFVDNGGSLFVDFNGKFNESIGLDPSLEIGTNVDHLNLLLSNFGIQGIEDPIVEPLGSVTLDLLNHTSLGRHAERVTHYGHYLEVSGQAQPVLETTNGKVSIASYINPNSGGKVLVSSSNYWLDNIALSGGRIPAGLDNGKFAQDVWEWLFSTDSIIKLDESYTESSISGTLSLISDGIVSSSPPDVYLESNQFVSEKPILLTDNFDGTFSFIESFASDEGIFRIIAQEGDEYQIWENIVDNASPIIRSISLNNSVIESKTFHIFEFTISDLVSGINEDSLTIMVNDLETDLDASINDNQDLLQVIIREEDLPEPIIGFYYLIITIEDNNDNKSTHLFAFKIEGTFTSSDNNTTPTESEFLPSDKGFNLFDFTNEITTGLLVLAVVFLALSNYRLRQKKPESMDENP